jgi:hypothetical protein
MAVEYPNRFRACKYCGNDISYRSILTQYCSSTCRKKFITVSKGGTPLSGPKGQLIIDGKKECTQCHEWKYLEDFRLVKSKYYDSSCKKCNCERAKIHQNRKRLINPEECNRLNMEWKRNNKEKIQAYRAKYAEKNGKTYTPNVPGYIVACLSITGRLPVEKTEEQKELDRERRLELEAEKSFNEWMSKKTDQEVDDWYLKSGKPWQNPRLSASEKYSSRYKYDKEFAISERLRRQIKKAATNDGVSELIRQSLKNNRESSRVKLLLGYSIRDL